VALFGKGQKQQAPKPTPGRAQQDANEALPVVGRQAFCRICGKYMTFSRCWLRPRQMVRCPECGQVFGDVGEVYAKFQPACPQCKAPLESPGFEYGLCDGCGSKYELVAGAKPGLVPNREQRAAMDKLGRVWRNE